MIDIDKMMIQQKISHPSTTQNIDNKNKISNLIQLIKLNKNNIMTQIEQSKKSAQQASSSKPASKIVKKNTSIDISKQSKLKKDQQSNNFMIYKKFSNIDKNKILNP